jgi:hypothetical protein
MPKEAERDFMRSGRIPGLYLERFPSNRPSKLSKKYSVFLHHHTTAPSMEPVLTTTAHSRALVTKDTLEMELFA